MFQFARMGLSRAAGGASAAAILLGGEAAGMATDFRSRSGQTLVRDPLVPANNYKGKATSWWRNVGTSPKLVRQSDGSLKWAPHNLALNTRWANAGALPTSYVAGSVGGTATPVASLFHAGHSAYRFQGTAERPFIQSSTSIVPIGVIEISATFEAGASVSWNNMISYTGTGVVVGYYVNGVLATTNGAIIPVLVPGNRIALVVQMTTTGVARFGLGVSGAGTGDFTIAAPMVRQQPVADSVYLENTSITAAKITAAQDHHSTKGWALLVEPAATNLVLHSTNFGEAGWLASNATKTTGQLAPDGTNTALLITATAGGPSTHNIARSNFFTTVIAQVYTASVYAKAGTSGWLYFSVGVGGGTAHRVYARFEFATETLSIVDSGGSWVKGTTAYAVNVGNGWYRIVMSFTDSVAENAGLNFGPGPVASITWTATGTETVYVWAPQIETGAIETSPIPTAAATVTRAIDRIDQDYSKLPAGADWTLYADFDLPPVLQTVATNSLFAIGDGAATEVVAVYANGVSLRTHMRDGGATVADLGAAGHVASARGQIAASFALNDAAGSINGGAILTDLVAPMPSGFTLVGIGHLANGGSPLAEPVRFRRLLAVPRKVPNADLPTWRYAA